MNAYIHTYIQVKIATFSFVEVQELALAGNMHKYIHACMNTNIRSFIHTCIHTYKYSYIHAYIHTYR